MTISTGLRILVAEDEKRMAAVIRQALEEAGYFVTVAQNGFRALETIRRKEHDLLVLDIMLPGINGFDIIQAARSEEIRLPILVLTAMDALDDRVRGLDMGADDYLLKPFRVAELLARVRAQIRRASERASRLKYGDLQIETTTRSVRRRDREIKLSATEFAVLEVLMRYAGTPVTKKSILRRVWNEEGYRDSNLVEVYIRSLRQKIEGEGEPRILHTSRGKGYMIAIDENA